MPLPLGIRKKLATIQPHRHAPNWVKREASGKMAKVLFTVKTSNGTVRRHKPTITPNLWACKLFFIDKERVLRYQ